MNAALRYHLQAQIRYVLGGPVVIGFTIENLCSVDVWVLKWYTPLEGMKGKIFELTCDGVDIPYEGRLMKRGNPEADDYVRLHPGESVHGEFDLASAYSLPVCKECRLKFKGRIHDVVFNHREVPRRADEHLSVDVPGNTASFSMVRG
jgi:peptidyl-Lys metalloendopeptidase